LHDAFVDRFRHRGAYVAANETVDRRDGFRIAFRNHHFGGIAANSPDGPAIPSAIADSRRIAVAAATEMAWMTLFTREPIHT
jgi:hypothetical protein